MMRFELRLEKPERRRALASAVTIALAYVVGPRDSELTRLLWAVCTFE